MGGAVRAIETGYMKSKLVESNTQRIEAIERGDLIVVGVNKFREHEDSPLTMSGDSIAQADPGTEADADRGASRRGKPTEARPRRRTRWRTCALRLEAAKTSCRLRSRRRKPA